MFWHDYIKTKKNTKYKRDLNCFEIDFININRPHQTPRMKTINQQANVTKEDQEKINNFSKMYSRHQQIVKQLADLKEKFEKHDDTLTEMELNEDDDIVRYRFGNCFFYLPTQQAKDLVEHDKTKVEKQLKAKKDESDQNQKKMKKMKATLYSKFGNSINLED